MEETQFGRYRLIELLGEGGMGEVWRAHDTEIDRMVALKRLLPNFGKDQTFEQRFRREARTAARLDNPHVVPIYDVGEIDGRLYVSMRLIDGQDLQTLLGAGPLPAERAVAIIDQIAKALGAAHKVGLVHRDIKPSNILVTDDDFAYLIDFGIARTADEAGLTVTGQTIGTWSYMAPERFGSGQTEPSSDIYALACVLYQCLTGQLPFPGSTFEQIAMAHMTTAPPQPSILRPDISGAMDSVIATGLAKDPALRYATTRELASAARDAMTEPNPNASITPPPTAPATEPEAAPQPDIEPTRQSEMPASPATLASPDGANSPTALLSGSTETRQQIPPTRVPPAPLATPTSAATTPRPTASWRRKAVLIPAVVLAAAIIAIGTFLLIPNDTGGPYGPQVALPFNDIQSPTGVALDSSGAVFVADSGNKRVLKLSAGSATQEVLPFEGIIRPYDVAVDSADTVYVTDTYNNRLLKLAAGSTTPEALSFIDLDRPEGVAVGSDGTIYVAKTYSQRVLKFAPGSRIPEVLPFDGLNLPTGVAVDSNGSVFVADFANHRVLKLEARSHQQSVLPFSGLDNPSGLVVGVSGAIFVTDSNNNRVLELAAGSTQQRVLPFTRLSDPSGVAVAKQGSVYVTDKANNRVLKLPAR